MEKLLLTDKDVAEILSISRMHVWNCVRSGSLPKPYKFGNCTRWKYSEIVEAIEDLKKNA